jgi:hypothetical protein
MIIKSIYVSFTHLYRKAPQKKSSIGSTTLKSEKRPSISPNLELKQVLNPKQLKIGFLPVGRTFGLDIECSSVKGKRSVR